MICQSGNDGATATGITVLVECQDCRLNDCVEKLLRLNTDTPPVIANQACANDCCPVHLLHINWNGRRVEGGEYGLHNAGDVSVGD